MFVYSTQRRRHLLYHVYFAYKYGARVNTNLQQHT